nr:acetylxylan esterase [Algoriphagus sp.]
LRPGPSGNPSAPNAANSDESKAKQYKEVPDPLVFENGSSVQSLEDWERRKKELYGLFDLEMYGKTPANLLKVNWIIVEEKDSLIGKQEFRYRKLKG